MWMRAFPNRYGPPDGRLVWWAPITTSLASYWSCHDPKEGPRMAKSVGQRISLRGLMT